MRLAATFLVVLAIALAGCESLLEPQATVTGGLNSPTIAQAQAVPYNGPRARIAVVSFDQKAAKGYGRVGDGLADMLATELVNTNRFIVLERQELGAVMAEQDLARSGRVSAATGAPTGQIEGAELLVTGAVTAFEPNYQGGSVGGILLSRRHPGGLGAGLKQAYVAIDMRIIDARTSRIVGSVAGPRGWASASAHSATPRWRKPCGCAWPRPSSSSSAAPRPNTTTTTPRVGRWAPLSQQVKSPRAARSSPSSPSQSPGRNPLRSRPSPSNLSRSRRRLDNFPHGSDLREARRAIEGRRECRARHPAGGPGSAREVVLRHLARRQERLGSQGIHIHDRPEMTDHCRA